MFIFIANTGHWPQKKGNQCLIGAYDCCINTRTLSQRCGTSATNSDRSLTLHICCLVKVEGLPDWRMPAFYFRKMRKINLAEGLLYLLGKLTIILQGFELWTVPICMELKVWRHHHNCWISYFQWFRRWFSTPWTRQLTGNDGLQSKEIII